MHHPVDGRGGGHGVGKDALPLREDRVWGDAEGSPLVAGGERDRLPRAPRPDPAHQCPEQNPPVGYSFWHLPTAFGPGRDINRLAHSKIQAGKQLVYQFEHRCLDNAFNSTAWLMCFNAFSCVSPWTAHPGSQGTSGTKAAPSSLQQVIISYSCGSLPRQSTGHGGSPSHPALCSTQRGIYQRQGTRDWLFRMFSSLEITVTEPWP